jgi:hypothetical protein
MAFLPNLINVGQSIVEGTQRVNNQPVVDFASIARSGGNPQIALDRLDAAGIGVGKLLRFPSDTPPYFMALPIHAYSRASWRSVGTLNEEARIILPLPRDMVDNTNVRFETEALGAAGAVGLGGVGDLTNSLQGAAVAAGLALGKDALDKLGKLGGQASKAAQGALAAAGYAVNDFMTVMLKGPEYKRRDFSWRFSPKSAEESRNLRLILQMIQNSMSTSLAGTGVGSAFFKWPKVWKPEFIFVDSPGTLALNTFRMKPSVLVDCGINYTPMGQFSPFATTKMPESVELRLSFLELEYWLAGDYDDNGRAGSTGLSIRNPNTGSTTDLGTIGNPAGDGVGF